MGSSDNASPSPAFLSVFRQEALEGRMSFERFMELALYHPQVGYYRADRQRVGYAAGTDFFTASTSAPLFGELVSAAASSLLRADPGTHTFVEIGAEKGAGILEGRPHPFAGYRCIRAGEPLNLTGPLIVFSNELFDAQPFRRYLAEGGRWVEQGVGLDQDRLVEVPLGRPPAPSLGEPRGEGQRLDAPLASAALCAEIARQPWTGLFLAFDYGKSWESLLHDTPQGTARVYWRHQQSNDLLARPGEQDLTCHVCWDWLSQALLDSGFGVPELSSQESFFMRHSQQAIAALIGRTDPQGALLKRSLTQLLHPAHLGQRFQVLHAVRDRLPDSPVGGPGRPGPQNAEKSP